MTQLYFEDVKVGMELPALVEVPTTESLVRYAAAANDFSRVHYDDPYARARGLKTVIVQGLLKAAFLGRMITDWAGPQAWVKKFATTYRGLDFPGEPITCRGRVSKKSDKGETYFVEIEMWTENGKGEVTTTGTATVLLPTKKARKPQPRT